MSLLTKVNELITFVDSLEDDIESQCNDILNFWFNDDGNWMNNFRNKWFVSCNSIQQKKLDDLITKKYGKILKIFQGNDEVLNEWILHSPKACLAVIIVLDQFSRHVYRNEMKLDKGKRINVDKNDKIAISVANLFFGIDIDSVLCNDVIAKCKWDALNIIEMFTIPQICFLLLPYRHSKEHQNIDFVLKQINKCQQNVSCYDKLIQKFKKATIRDLNNVANQNKNVDDILEFNGFDYDFKNNDDNVDDIKEDINVKTKTKRKWKKRICINGNESQKSGKNAIMTNPLYTTMKQFLHNYIKKYHNKIESLFVSLSGGVDSMVITKILYYLKIFEDEFKSVNIICIHINYNNRTESTNEADFLNQWCIKHGIIFKLKTISHIKRGITKRDVYEKESRDIRFNMYKKVLNEYNCLSNNIGIMFGHHKGDVQENIISNMMKGCSLLNLNGMFQESIVNSVTIWRPLLSHVKDSIYHFSHTFGVPYFKDTTPDWSTRGRMRNQLLPLLTDMYGNGFLNNLSTLGKESTQFKDMAMNNIFKPFYDRIKHSNLAVWVDFNGFQFKSVLFWKECLRYMTEDIIGIPKIHEKGIQRQLLTKIQSDCNHTNNKNNNGWLQLRREYKCYIHNTTLFIFIPEFCLLYPGKQIKYNNYVDHETKIPLVMNKTYTFGPWNITFSKDDINALNNKDHRVSIFDIANAKFHYYLPLLNMNNTESSYYIDRKATGKTNRAFKGLPHGSKNILPLVSCKGTVTDNTNYCVKVTTIFIRPNKSFT